MRPCGSRGRVRRPRAGATSWVRALGALAAGALLALGGPHPPARAAQAVDLELVLAVDISGSIDEEEARLQRGGYVGALADPGVLAAIRGGRHKRIAAVYVEWAGYQNQTTVVDWTLIHDEASARAFAARIAAAPYRSGRFTSISGVIDYAVPLFGMKDFRGTRRVLDISGDGPNNSGRLVTAARDAAVAAGVTINGLPIVNSRPNRFGIMPMPHLDHYYRNCVIGGAGAFIVAAKNFASFASAIRRKLILEIVGVPPGEGVRPLPAAAGGWLPDCDAGERRRWPTYDDRY